MTHATTEKRDQRPAPAAEHRGERHRERRRHGRAHLDPGRVDARPGRGALGHGLADRERRERVAEPHADPDRPGEQHDEPGARHDRAEHPEDADQRERRSSSRGVCRAGREVRGDGREEPHAEHGDRPEQPDERVRGVEVVLDLVDQRADADDLRAKRERREEQPRERDDRPAAGDSASPRLGPVPGDPGERLDVLARLAAGRGRRCRSGSPRGSARAARRPRRARRRCRRARS